jgi:cbb3-type cytochrome oxidase subunit 3
MADNYLHKEDSGKKNCFGKIMGIEKKKEQPENVIPAKKDTIGKKVIDFNNVISGIDTTEKSRTNSWNKNKVVQFFAGPTALLISSLGDFYKLYGKGRFISGIVLALFFAGYIHYLTAKAKKKKYNENSLTGD